MLAGAKIAKRILEEVSYNKEKSNEIVDIISIHDADQIDEWGLKKYDTYNKKLFHDFDRLDMFNRERIEKYFEKFVKTDEDKIKLKSMIDKVKENMFFDEFKELAKKRMKNLDFFY